MAIAYPSTMGKSILIAGLGRFTPAPAVKEVLQKIESELKKTQEAGYETTDLQVNPDDLKGSIGSFSGCV